MTHSSDEPTAKTDDAEADPTENAPDPGPSTDHDRYDGPFSAEMEAEVSRRVLGDRRHGFAG